MTFKNLTFGLIFLLVSFKAEFKYQDQALLNDISRDYLEAVIKRKKHIRNQIVTDINGKHWTSNLTYTNLNRIKNFDIEKDSDIVDFNRLFNKENFQVLKKEKQYKTWSKIFPDLKFHKKKESNFIVSLPILNEEKNYAIFYVGDDFSGNLVVYKKEGDEWKYFAIGSIWIS